MELPTSFRQGASLTILAMRFDVREHSRPVTSCLCKLRCPLHTLVSSLIVKSLKHLLSQGTRKEKLIYGSPILDFLLKEYIVLFCEAIPQAEQFTSSTCLSSGDEEMVSVYVPSSTVVDRCRHLPAAWLPCLH